MRVHGDAIPDGLRHADSYSDSNTDHHSYWKPYGDCHGKRELYQCQIEVAAMDAAASAPGDADVLIENWPPE